MHKAIYDGRYKSTLMMCGRQVGKSTSLANFIIAESISLPHFKEYYVSPTKEQTLIFSNTRVGKTLAYSPLVKKHFQSPEHADRVLHRAYTNGSENAFTYACEDADRARGFSADRCSFDEFQDMLADAVVPVVVASMKNSKYRYETYTGTPKTMENAIQAYWEKSTQSEWVMKCEGCGKYNFVVSEKSIGKRGPICLGCGKTLNPRTGFWVDMHKPEPPPGWDPTTGVDFRYIKGFHIPSPIMPLNVPTCHESVDGQRGAQERWNDILTDMEKFGPSKFRNEVLGVSDAIGRRLISLEELKSLCTGPACERRPGHQTNMKGVSVIVAGVDWSGGGTSGVSRTVLWLWGYVPAEQKLRTLFYKIFPGQNPVADVKEILEILAAYSVTIVVGDAGEGALPNSMLRDALGPHRVTMVQYGSYQWPCRWNGLDRYNADRTTLIDNYLMILKKQGVVYPPYEECSEPIKDILNVYEEVTTLGKKVWRHAPTLPDDSLHAQIFGWFAFKLHTTDLKFYA